MMTKPPRANCLVNGQRPPCTISIATWIVNRIHIDFDDDLQVYEDRHVQADLTGTGNFRALTTTQVAAAPPTWTSYRLDFQLHRFVGLG